MADKPKAQAKEPEPPRQRNCGTMQVHERLLRTNPEYVRARVASENYHREFVQQRGIQARAGLTSIPVVVHVVYNTAQQNISVAQIQSQIDVLNRDYRLKNSDSSSIPTPFKSLAADARVEFALATQDPGGNATDGIMRSQTNKASFPDDDTIKSAATGGADAWPADKYLNIWVAPRLTSPQGDLLGYAQFSGGPAATDGVVILHSAFGTTGTAAPPFNLGRTATHEIGHWLNLRHIWGDDGNGCNGSDFVNDTPNQAGPNYGTPAFPHITCNNSPNGDMFMNYMDYVDDAAMFMFTAGQVDRMQACLDGDRSSIGTTSGTLKFSEDIGPSLKFRDDGPTLKFVEDMGGPTLKFRDDGGPTLKFVEDMGGPTLKFRDDGGPTLKFSEDVKQPGYDKIPSTDQPKFPASDQPGFPQPGGGPFFGRWARGRFPQAGRWQAYGGGGRAAPFVLSTPHHSMAWVQTFPQAAQAAVAAYEQQIQQYEDLLNIYAQAEMAGQLGPEDQQQAEALYQEYQALMQEYQQLITSM